MQELSSHGGHSTGDIERVWVYDLHPEAAHLYAKRRVSEGYLCEVAPTVASAVRAADVIITATWSTTPLLTASMLPLGAHITTLGPDSPGKAEVDADLLEAARVVVDDLVLARAMGSLDAWPDRSFSAVSLTGVLLNEAAGRRDADQLTVFGSVGLPFRDLVAAWHVFQAAHRRGLGPLLS